MRILLIAAFADNHVLGRDNALPWTLPDDWAHFRAVTGSAPFVTGRKSYEAEDRLLSPGRNLILTRRRDRLPEPNCAPVPSLDAALAELAGEERVFVTGGSSVFREALPRADEAWFTLVHAQPEGDAWFPPVDWPNWETLEHRFHPADDRHAHPFSIVHLRRRAPWSLDLPRRAAQSPPP
jgi:dihydrofolate reductase